MYTLAVLSALLASATAQSYFRVMSTRSASPIHFLPLTARGQKFYLNGGPPSTYCPDVVGDACPKGDTTVLAGGYDYLSLAVMVPGGQQVYVAPDGSLSYTQAHSAYIPDGSILDGWSRTESESFGHLIFRDGLIACPTGEDEKGWQVFGNIAGVQFDPACLGFNAVTVNTTDVGAWQYT